MSFTLAFGHPPSTFGLMISRAACRRGVCGMWLAMFLFLTGCDRPGSTAAGSGVVRQVDHVVMVSSNASVVFEYLTKNLGLPVAWSLAEYGNFRSGGVYLGNVSLEIIDDPGAHGRPSRFTGFSLEPTPLEFALAELARRGIAHGDQARTRNAWFKTRWTTVSLPTLSDDAMEVFFCEYADSVAHRHSRLARELGASGGGPLGLVRLKELVIGTRDMEGAVQAWSALLAPATQSAEHVWALGAGPAIRIVPSDTTKVVGLVFEVRSVKQASDALRQGGLLGDIGGRRVSLRRGLLGAIDAVFEEATSPND